MTARKTRKKAASGVSLTNRSKCTIRLAVIDLDQFLRNDHVCEVERMVATTGPTRTTVHLTTAHLAR